MKGHYKITRDPAGYYYNCWVSDTICLDQGPFQTFEEADSLGRKDGLIRNQDMRVLNDFDHRGKVDVE